MVLFIDSAKTDAEIDTEEALSTTGIFGKSSAFSPLNLYLPSPALISIAKVVVCTENATGCSGRVVDVSTNILEGMATRHSAFASVREHVTILVCKSVAEIVNKLSLISNKQFSRIGNTVLLLEAPLIDCSCFNKIEVDTINLIS